MKRPIRLVLFDLGDTLIYEKEAWKPFFVRAEAALIEALRSNGLRVEPATLFRGSRGLLDLYYHRRGNEIEEETTAVLLKQLMAEQGYRDVGDQVISAALRAMYAVTQGNWYPEEDAMPTLQSLKERGFHIGLISNSADDENTRTLIDRGGFRPYLEFILSSALFGWRKPHPGIFHAALDHFGVPPEQAVMVGDTLEADILGANQAGINSIWITRRARETTGRPGIQADAVITALSEIPRLLSA